MKDTITKSERRELWLGKSTSYNLSLKGWTTAVLGGMSLVVALYFFQLLVYVAFT